MSERVSPASLLSREITFNRKNRATVHAKCVYTFRQVNASSELAFRRREQWEGATKRETETTTEKLALVTFLFLLFALSPLSGLPSALFSVSPFLRPTENRIASLLVESRVKGEERAISLPSPASFFSPVSSSLCLFFLASFFSLSFSFLYFFLNNKTCNFVLGQDAARSLVNATGCSLPLSSLSLSLSLFSSLSVCFVLRNKNRP